MPLNIKDIDETQAPLLDHLIELRNRLVKCVIALGIAFGVCLYFADDIFAILVHPLAQAFPAGQGKLIYTKLYEAFFVDIKVALFAAFFPVGQLANISNSGTLFAFAAVSIAVMVIRKTDPGRHRPFKTPLIYVTAPIAILGCLYLFASLDHKSIILFLIWATIGLAVYFGYSRSRSHVGLGYDDEVHETDSDVPPQPVPPVS